MSFFAELKRRNVFKVGVAYIVAAWLILQLTEVLTELLELEADIGKIVILLLVVGFIPAVIFAWAFEMTPEGVKREKDVDRSQSITSQTGRKLNLIIIGMLTLGMAYFFWESRLSDRGPADTGVAAGEPKQTAEPMAEPEPATEVSRQSIAVLPFDNRSRLEEDEFFVEGIHDDLLTNLARIGSIKVISRTSVLRFKDTELPIPEIAAELGVATVMEGAVQRAGDTVRINVQLIDAQTDEHLWAEIFDRKMTTDNLFAIQSEISRAIAAALETTLTDQEQEQIDRRPTDNLAAYNAYLLGRQLLPKRTSAALEQARGEFENAVELDPDFALAWIGIAEAAFLQSSYGTQDFGQTLGIMESAVKRALEIDPLLGEAYATQGQFHQQNERYPQAEEAYRRAIELSPNYATAYHWYANLLGSQPTRSREGLALIEKAAELDPLSPIIRSSRGWILQHLGEFELAEAIYKSMIELNPDFPRTMAGLAFLYSNELGRFDEAYKWMLKSQRLDPGNIFYLRGEYQTLLNVGASDLAVRTHQRMEELDDKHTSLTLAGIFSNLKNGQYAAAREQASFLRGTDDTPFSRWISGLVYAVDEDYVRAREMLLASTPAFTDRNQWARLLDEFKADACTVAWVLMRTGDQTLGLDLLDQAIVYLEDTLPQYIRHADRYDSALCHAARGDSDAALAALERRVAHNHIEGWWFYKTWPPMRRVLDDPRFVALDERVAAELARQRGVIEAIAAANETGP